MLKVIAIDYNRFYVHRMCLEPAKVKYPSYIEKEKCIPFDAGLLHKIKRQIIIRIHWNNVIYTFESDLDALKKIADGRRHRVNHSD